MKYNVWKIGINKEGEHQLVGANNGIPRERTTFIALGDRGVLRLSKRHAKDENIGIVKLRPREIITISLKPSLEENKHTRIREVSFS